MESNIEAATEVVKQLGGIEKIQELSDNAKNAVMSLFSKPAEIHIELETTSAIDQIKLIRSIITVIIILWGIALIVLDFTDVDEKKKERIKNTNNVIMGGMGVIPTLFILWIGILLVISLYDITPLIKSGIPQFNGLLGNLVSGVKTISGG